MPSRGHSIFQVLALLRSKFLIRYFMHNFEIYMKKNQMLSVIERNKSLNQILPQNKATIIHKLETPNSTLNMVSPKYVGSNDLTHLVGFTGTAPILEMFSSCSSLSLSGRRMKIHFKLKARSHIETELN